MRFLLFICLFFLPTIAKDFSPFLSFSSSKSELVKIYSQHKTLPLSGLNYVFDPHECAVDGFVYGLGKEAEKILWRYLVPEKLMGAGMPCMREKICLSTFSHRYFKGPICCRKVSKTFKNMSADMHNIIPTVSKESVDDLVKVENIAHKGRIARIYLYMKEQYKLKTANSLDLKMRIWHANHPVSEWERRLNRKIFQLQGTFNPYIEKL